MGLKEFLKKHEVKEDDEIFGDDGDGETIDVSNAYKALKDFKNRKS